MCYDKLESGILQLHMETISTLPFLQECLDGFHAESRARDITLNFNPLSLPQVTCDNSSGAHSARRSPFSLAMNGQHQNDIDHTVPLSESDVINVDKFQVSPWNSDILSVYLTHM